MGWTYNERMRQWLTDLAEAVTELQEGGGFPSFEELADDPVFSDAVVDATRAAQATHQREKLEALRNGVLHSLDPDAPSVDEQARFFRLVEQFTPAHLKVLAFLDGPADAYDKSRSVSDPPETTLEAVMPEFTGMRDWYRLLERDIAAGGLAEGHLMGNMPVESITLRCTTPLGKRFLQFISAP